MTRSSTDADKPARRVSITDEAIFFASKMLWPWNRGQGSLSHRKWYHSRECMRLPIHV